MDISQSSYINGSSLWQQILDPSLVQGNDFYHFSKW